MEELHPWIELLLPWMGGHFPWIERYFPWIASFLSILVGRLVSKKTQNVGGTTFLRFLITISAQLGYTLREI